MARRQVVRPRYVTPERGGGGVVGLSILPLHARRNDPTSRHRPARSHWCLHSSGPSFGWTKRRPYRRYNGGLWKSGLGARTTARRRVDVLLLLRVKKREADPRPLAGCQSRAHSLSMASRRGPNRRERERERRVSIVNECIVSRPGAHWTLEIRQSIRHRESPCNFE